MFQKFFCMFKTTMHNVLKKIQTSFFFITCIPFIFKIGEGFNIDEWNNNISWISFLWHIWTPLVQMCFEFNFVECWGHVSLTKVIPFYVIKKMDAYLHYKWYSWNYLSLAHNCKLNMKHAKFGIIDQHMNATCYMQYLCTLASSTLIILFSKMLKISNFLSSK
jgi:hypothetical protein